MNNIAQVVLICNAELVKVDIFLIKALALSAQIIALPARQKITVQPVSKAFLIIMAHVYPAKKHALLVLIQPSVPPATVDII